MCTVSWQRLDEGCELFFNRDERRSRAPARPPAALRAGTTRYVAPLDGDFGGSWLAVNEYGLILFLLNGYAAAEAETPLPPPGFTSRGLLLTDLIDGRSVGEIEQRLGRFDLSRYRSFVIAALGPGPDELRGDWRAGRLTVEAALPPLLVSSSFDTEAVQASRAEEFRRTVTARGGSATPQYLAFHESHRPRRGPYSPCMHRPDAATVSFSHVRVEATQVLFRYVPHSPCRGRPGNDAVVLPRVQGRSERPASARDRNDAAV